MQAPIPVQTVVQILHWVIHKQSALERIAAQVTGLFTEDRISLSMMPQPLLPRLKRFLPLIEKCLRLNLR